MSFLMFLFRLPVFKMQLFADWALLCIFIAILWHLVFLYFQGENIGLAIFAGRKLHFYAEFL